MTNRFRPVAAALWAVLVVEALVSSAAHAADTKISAMPAASSVSFGDIFPIVQSGTNKKVSFSIEKNLWDSYYEPLFTFRYSLSLSGGFANLVGDTFAPGDSKCYSTDSGGSRGWNDCHALINFAYSIHDTAGTVSLIGDVPSPGNNKCYSTDGSGSLGWHSCGGSHSVTFVVDGSGGVLSSGTKNPIKLAQDASGNLQGWVLIAKPSGSVTVDLYRASDGSGLPTTSIIGSGTMPALGSAVENSSTDFTGWTSITLNAGDNLAINVSGVTSVTYLALTLYFQ